MKWLFVLLLAIVIFGGAAFFSYNIFVKQEMAVRAEQRADATPQPTPDFGSTEFRAAQMLKENGRLSEARAALTAATLEAEEQRTVWVRDAQDAKTKRQGLLDQYQDLKDQRQRIVNAGADGICPTCARPLGAEFAKVLELLDRQVEEVRSNGNFYKQRIEQLQQEPAALIEIERSVFDEAHGTDGGDEFRQRRSLIDRVGRRILAIGAGKGDAALIDQRDAG